jgi:hypothetical protein
VECYVGQDELCRFEKEGEGSLGVDILCSVEVQSLVIDDGIAHLVCQVK